MTIAEALSGIKIPAFEDYYDANTRYLDENGDVLPKLTEWIAYNLVSETPTQFADDGDVYTRQDWDVHFFTRSKTNATSYKKTIRNALRTGGFIILQSQKLYENDTQYYHVIVSVTLNDITEV